MPAARADGDPASDYLLSQDTFLPFDANISKEQAAQLNTVVADAKKQGFTIKVAVIAKPFDLGAVPSLYGKPKTYARFLGQELFFLYKGRLLIVMPNGYGASRGGKPLPSTQRVLDRMAAPQEGGAALTAAAARAVQRLAAQHPDTESQLFGADGALNRYVNVYLNDEDVRVLDGLETTVGERDVLVILPAMAGG